MSGISREYKKGQFVHGNEATPLYKNEVIEAKRVVNNLNGIPGIKTEYLEPVS